MKNYLIASIALLLLSCNAKKKADLLVYNATIIQLIPPSLLQKQW